MKSEIVIKTASNGFIVEHLGEIWLYHYFEEVLEYVQDAMIQDLEIADDDDRRREPLKPLPKLFTTED